MNAKHLAHIKWWLTGIAPLAAVADRMAADRSPIPLFHVSAFLALSAWVVDGLAQRRRAAEVWPERFERQQRDALLRILRAVDSGVVAINYVKANDPARVFAQHLHALVSDAGWRTEISELFWSRDEELVGLEIVSSGMFPMSPPLAALAKELAALGFPIRFTNVPSSPDYS